MWQRFTERARRVILLAQEEAQKLNSPDVGTAHLLLGLVREAEGVPAQLLLQQGLSYDRVHMAVKFSTLSIHQSDRIEPELNPQGQQALAWAADEATLLKHNYIGSEHLLLALLRDSALLGSKLPTALSIMLSIGLNAAELRTHLLNSLKSQQPLAEPDAPFVGTNANQRATRKPGRYDTTLRLHFMLSLSALEAQAMGHKKLDMEHWLYVLLRERDDRHTKLLAECGLDLDAATALIANQLKAQSPPDDVRILQQEIADLNQQKEQAVREDEYERAADLRDRIDELEATLRPLMEQWRNSQNSPDKANDTQNDAASEAQPDA